MEILTRRSAALRIMDVMAEDEILGGDVLSAA